ncbi:OmpA family protein [Sphingobium sp. SYK-6]|uniref:OmpA family protein n=1 Tax=Sphingobium sp. (strain NBRC 103272 / SYK-6) TaxID=627192 RepID=UPI0002277247|nr:OmpA family protein [Sphingobium sp. SYK-6]BAK66961.1 OmpA family protein [Sphingobium sp. SYK-6]
MTHRFVALRPALAALGCAALLGGCATKTYVNEQIGALEARQNARIDAVDRTAQEALERAKAARQLAEGKFVYSVVLSDDKVHFPTGSAALSREAEKGLAELAQKLIAENRNVFLEIQGYTDNVGSAASNLRLAQARADAAMLFLHKQGIRANRMSTIAYGEAQPVAPNTTPEGRAKNRRIVVIVLD